MYNVNKISWTWAYYVHFHLLSLYRDSTRVALHDSQFKNIPYFIDSSFNSAPIQDYTSQPSLLSSDWLNLAGNGGCVRPKERLHFCTLCSENESQKGFIRSRFFPHNNKNTENQRKKTDEITPTCIRYTRAHSTEVTISQLPAHSVGHLRALK